MIQQPQSVKRQILIVAAGVVLGAIGLYLVLLVVVTVFNAWPLGFSNRPADPEKYHRQAELMRAARTEHEADSLNKAFLHSPH